MTGTDEAFGLAWERAQEQDSECPLFSDPFARRFVDAAVARGWRPPAGDRDGYAVARTKWFDEFLIAACANGIVQAVILAPGLDARAWRLPWVSDSVLYEVDEPRLLALKEQTLRGSPAAATYIPVALGGDWPEKLRTAGFDPDEPTAWALEGPELLAADHDSLFERIHELSARDSRIAVELPGRPAWLCDHGWDATAASIADLLDRYSRCAVGDADESRAGTSFVTARRAN
ncbi:SAM-dependent methyltransferase [Mycolicibacterium phlei]